jgi:hypothetical protein
MANNRINRIAEGWGYKNPEELLRAMLDKYHSIPKVAEILGMSKSGVSNQVKKYAIRKTNPDAREKFVAKLAAWNKEYGTEFTTAKQFFVYMFQQHGINKAVQVTGATKRYIYYCVESENSKTRGEYKQSDYRGPTIDGPWTRRDKSPCCACNFKRRDKNEPGCFNCDLRLQYVALLNGYPSTNGDYSFDINHGIGEQMSVPNASTTPY